MAYLILLIAAYLIYRHFQKSATRARSGSRFNQRVSARVGRGNCSRCEGTGRYGWNRRAGGVCFKCHGTGKYTGRAFARA